MKKFFTSVVIICCSLHVYSQYYGTYNVKTNENININKHENINVSGYVQQTQTIHNIDYGALALANAEQEKNRLAAQQYQDEQQKQLAISIANNPLKAYDYGQVVNHTFKGKNVGNGFKTVSQWWIFPNYFFNFVGFNELQNISEDGITTFFGMTFVYKDKSRKQEIEDYVEGVTNTKVGDTEVGEFGDTLIVLDVKKSIATVWCKQGYKITIYWQQNGQIGITENYFAYEKMSETGNDIAFICKVRYFGEIGEISWEKLEGRRYYLKSLIEKVISTAYISNVKVPKEK